MQALLFNIFYALTWLVAQLPKRAIYGLSDLTFLIIYHILRYRRSVVQKNLLNSFPEKTTNEINAIEKKYYKHLCDLFFENFFLIHASKKRVMKMCRFNGYEIFDKYYSQDKSIVVAIGHYGNWELFSLFCIYSKHLPVAVFKPLSNKRFENLLINSRKRFGGVTVSMKNTIRALYKYRNERIPVIFGLFADQTPAAKDMSYWTNFLNQDTPVFLGVEKIAQKFDMPVYFSYMNKISRGFYEVNFKLLTETPKECESYEITEMYIKALEDQIVDKPEYWLWSHRRWKLKRKPN